MIRFREFLAGTILSKSTVIAKNVRSFFEINCPFESKHDRTQHRSYMTRNMTVVSKSTEGIQSPSFEKGWALFISKRKSLYHFEEKVHHHFEEKVHHHFEVTVNHHLEMRVNPSSRNESQSIISKRKSIVISKRQPIHHFEKTVRASFQNDSFDCDKSPINLK